MSSVRKQVESIVKGVWHSQGRTVRQVVKLAYLPALLVVIVAALQPGIRPSVLFADPSDTLDAPFFVGMISHTGVVFWAAAATICLFTSELMRRTGGDRGLARFFMVSGLLTGYMMWDDLLMFHERLFPVYLGITEGVPKIMLLVAILAFLLYYRATILRSQYALLGLSLAFLAFSFTIDVSFIQTFIKQYADISFQSYYYLEDGSKLLGIVGWFTYFATFAKDVLTARLGVGAAGPAIERANSPQGQFQRGEVEARIG
jgi:hypothetical protein